MRCSQSKFWVCESRAPTPAPRCGRGSLQRAFLLHCLVEPRLLERADPLLQPVVAPQTGAVQEVVAFVSQWDQHNRLWLEDSKHKPLLRFSKIFPVPKSDEEDRGVMDRRIPNCFEHSLALHAF